MDCTAGLRRHRPTPGSAPPFVGRGQSCILGTVRGIMKMRFGLEDGSEHTLEEVGIEFAVSRERIRSNFKLLRKISVE